MAMVISGDAGITFPNGSTQQAAATLPSGLVLYFANTTAPAGWLECNGAAVSRTEYAGLFAAIGTLYGAGNGTSTFNLPDLRGEFIRTWDNGRGVDSGRVIGSAQLSQMQRHTHTITTSFAAVGTSFIPAGSNNDGAQNTQTTSAAGGTSNDSETRPRNIAMMACIKT